MATQEGRSAKKPRAVEDDTRFDPAHMAVSMMRERIAEDKRKGLPDLFTGEVNARALYFKGAHDMIKCIEEWTKMGLDPNTYGMLLKQMFEQTADPATGHAH